MNHLLNYRRILTLCLALCGLVVSLPTPAAADDRDLLKKGVADPFVFFILDTSGSMNWSPPCTAADFAANKCDFLCPTGDCAVSRDGDDPSSKMRQAKEAIAEVINGSTKTRFGFATYNQDKMQAVQKEWLYQLANPYADLYNLKTKALGCSAADAVLGACFPALGALEVFGPAQGCDTGNGDAEIGCFPDGNRAADVDDSSNTYWERTRVQRIPRFGTPGTNGAAITFYVRYGWTTGNNGQVYRVTYTPVATPLAYTVPNAPANLTVSVEIRKCKSATTGNPTTCDTSPSNTTGSTQVYLKNLTYSPQGDFIMWDFQVQRAPGQDGYFGRQLQSQTNTCNGLDLNSDTSADFSGGNGTGYNIKQPTVVEGTAFAGFSAAEVQKVLNYGDFVPLDWRAGKDNKNATLQRLAPDLLLTPSESPTATNDGYANARYFQDTQTSGLLNLRDSGVSPLIPGGSTPIGLSMRSFRTWFDGCTGGNCSANLGWRNMAQKFDKDFGCRKVYVIFVTDGDDTCGGIGLNSGNNSGTQNSLCIKSQLPPAQQSQTPYTGIVSDTKYLKDTLGVTTYVVGFGLPASLNLSCMAQDGGTGTPIFPSNKQALVDALTTALATIKEDSATFASAAVPSVQKEAADNVFLTNFTPLGPSPSNDPSNAHGIWNGHLEAYLKPLDPDANGIPRKTACSATVRAKCFLWDAADELLKQAPTVAEVGLGTFKIGYAEDNRRVYYSPVDPAATVDPATSLPSSVPMNRAFLLAPTQGATPDYWSDLVTKFGYNTASGTADADMKSVINFTLEAKHSSIQRSGTPPPAPTPVDYILGDIFHSNPVVLERPGNFRYFVKDLNGNGNTCLDATNPNIGYRCFFSEQQCRRRMLFVGSNDGQLHAFDIGRFTKPDPLNQNKLTCNGQIPLGSYDDGTGRELFSYVPRAALSKLKSYSTTGVQDWSVDGSVIPDDVFIDPVHNGTPTAADRRWRTVLVAGMREGGRAYYALDVTKPDQNNFTTANSTLVPTAATYVQNCTSDTPSGDCGTVPFPSELWELTDNFDEDQNGFPDLGQTWSTPNVGRIRVCEGTRCDPATTPNDIVDKYVAIFGGGLDGAELPNYAAPEPNRGFKRSGNFLYMVDIETGKLIYKQQLDSSAPSQPAAVDTDQDGFIDTIYIGTAGGFMYKVDLSSSTTTGNIAKLQSASYTGLACVSASGNPCQGSVVTRTAKRVTDATWKPFIIFDTVDGVTHRRKQIYFQPVVIFAASIGRYALAFGTGDREDLWSAPAQQEQGRFYVILDTGFTNAQLLSGALPKTQANYASVDPEFSVSGTASRDFLLNPAAGSSNGWFMPLASKERIISDSFSLSGVTVFTSFLPTSGPDPNDPEKACVRGGDSHIFTVITNNANPVQKVGGLQARYVVATKFVTNPFTEQAQTKNKDPGNDTAQPLDDDKTAMMEYLKSLFPANCRFANYRVDIKTVRSDTGLVLIAPIPVCIIEKNWKEF
ncbi:MAG: PilC/PilY family type IV pilus protein [Pseudolysinimonas sp.]